MGAALGVFLFPVLLASIGTAALLFAVAGCCLVGLTITALLRIEPKGRSLAELSGGEVELSGRELAEVPPHPAPP